MSGRVEVRGCCERGETMWWDVAVWRKGNGDRVPEGASLICVRFLRGA